MVFPPSVQLWYDWSVCIYVNLGSGQDRTGLITASTVMAGPTQWCIQAKVGPAVTNGQLSVGRGFAGLTLFWIWTQMPLVVSSFQLFNLEKLSWSPAWFLLIADEAVTNYMTVPAASVTKLPGLESLVVFACPTCRATFTLTDSTNKQLDLQTTLFSWSLITMCKYSSAVCKSGLEVNQSGLPFVFLWNYTQGETVLTFQTKIPVKYKDAWTVLKNKFVDNFINQLYV